VGRPPITHPYYPPYYPYYLLQHLSEARAKAVTAALTAQYGIAAARLAPYGCGPLAPVASNDTEEGKAKNRRVELFKR